MIDPDRPIGGDPIDTAPAEEPSGRPWWQELLSSPTGPGLVDQYIDHPANWQKSSAMAQVLRGATGLVGNLDLAIIDIGLGILRLFSRPPGPVKEASRDEA